MEIKMVQNDNIEDIDPIETQEWLDALESVVIRLVRWVLEPKLR